MVKQKVLSSLPTLTNYPLPQVMIISFYLAICPIIFCVQEKKLDTKKIYSVFCFFSIYIIVHCLYCIIAL